MTRAAPAPIVAPTFFRDQVRRSSLGTIVMSKGVFDLTHAGHVESLQQASNYGETLVVAIAGDSSVRERKGPQRPILSFRERAALVSNLRVVDYVTRYDERSPFKILSQVRPEVFCASHFGYLTEAEVAELAEIGVTLRALSRPPERSTSEIIEAIMLAGVSSE